MSQVWTKGRPRMRRENGRKGQIPTGTGNGKRMKFCQITSTFFDGSPFSPNLNIKFTISQWRRGRRHKQYIQWMISQIDNKSIESMKWLKKTTMFRRLRSLANEIGLKLYKRDIIYVHFCTHVHLCFPLIESFLLSVLTEKLLNKEKLSEMKTLRPRRIWFVISTPETSILGLFNVSKRFFFRSVWVCWVFF